MKRIDELTGIRCVAVTMVVLAHAACFMPRWLEGRIPPALGDTGVEIFFVLSGFLITSQLAREYEQTGKINFFGFYRRRWLRIAPAFYFFLAVLGLLAAIGLLDICWQQFLISGTYIWNYARLLRIDGSYYAHPDGNWYLGHTWSLALEEQFYLLWPAILLLISRARLPRILPWLIMIVPLIRMASYFTMPAIRPYLQAMLHTGIDPILVGCYLSINRARLAERLHSAASREHILSLTVFVIVVALPVLQSRLGDLWLAVYGATIEASIIGLLILCLLAQPGHSFSRLLRTRFFLFMGTISYSLYLWQQLFNKSDSPVFFGFPLNIAAAVAAASLSYFIIERPFLILKNRGVAVMRAQADADAPRREPADNATIISSGK